MGLNGKQLLENFKEDEAYGNTTYTPPDDSSDDDNGDNAWKYISAGDISGLVDYTNRNYNYRTIPFLGQIVGHAADAATQGVADVAQFVGAQGVGDYLNEKAQEGEAELPAMSAPELSLAYLTDPNGLASAFGMMAGSMLSTAPVAAIAPELLPARAAMTLSKVPKALSAVPKIGGALEEMAPMAGRFALTGPIEAMMEGGNTEREMLQNGATPEEARQAAWNVFGENVGLLTATNALEGGLLGKIKIKTPHFSNPVVNTASRVAGYVPTTAAEMALQGYEEGAQQGIQNGVEGESPNTANQILNPFAWTDDQWDAAKLGVAGAVPLMGAMGAIRHFGNRGDNGSTAADSLLDQAQDDIDSITSQAAQQSVIQSAQQDMENNPYTAPTAMQDTSYEAPSDTSSGSSYDASALEGDPQYTVSGEVSSTDVTPLTDQKMRLLDAAYYNKYGQHLYITSMKRNGNPDESWHNSGQAFDTADDNLENNKEARDWLISEGEKLGLTPLDEYEHPSAKATGGHIHFSDHGEPISDGIRVGESDSDMDDSDTDDSTGGVDLSNLPVGDIAMAIAQNTNLPVNFIWSQLSHESDGGKSKLAVEDHNYGGVKGNDGNYLHFDNDQQFIDYMSKYYPKYREDGIYDAQTADQFAEALQHGGYFTADLGEYEGGMHRYLEQAGLSQDAMFGGKARRASRKGGDSTSSTPDLSGSFEISADDPAMDSMFASFAKDWQNMSTDANEINFFGDMFNSRNKFKATEENKQAILDNYGDAFRQYVQENQPQTVQAAQAAQVPAQPKQAPQPQHIEMQTPNLQTITTTKVEATTIQNVLSSFVQDKKNVARTEQEANLFDDMLDADDHFIDTPKNRQTLLKNYGAQLQDYVDDAMTPSLTDRVNQAIEQAVQNKDLNRMNTLTQAKQANDTAALEKLVGPQTKQHVDIAAMLTPANTDMKNHVSSTVQANAPVHRTATMEHQAPQTEVASTVQGNVPVNQVAATEDEQKAFRKAGLVYRDSNYNGTERVKTAPLYEEGDRRMNGGKSETKVKAQTAGKADKYKKDAEKIYLRFKSGKFSTEDSIKQLNNLKKKATSDKALSDEDRADVITEVDKHSNRIKPQKETKEHETQKYSSKTAETAQSGKAEGYPHQDAKPEKGRTDAEESEVKASSHFDTSDFKHTKTGEMIPAAKISSKVDADTYKAINSIAKKHGGYYNRYAKRFLFNKGGADGRDAFVEEAERSVFNGADSGTKESKAPVSAGVKRYKNAIDKIKKQYDDGEIDIDEYDNRFFALGDKWLRDAHLTDKDKKEVAAYSDKIDAAVEAEETRREKTRYDFIKKAAKSNSATKPRETKVTGSGNQILNGDTVDAVLKAQGYGVPSNLADYVRGVTREDVASIPDKRKKFIDEAIDTGAFRAIETDRGGYMLIGTKGGMFSSVTEITPAETVYYAMHGGLDFNKRSTKEAIMDDLATWYGSEKPREIKSQEEPAEEKAVKTDNPTNEEERVDSNGRIFLDDEETFANLEDAFGIKPKAKQTEIADEMSNDNELLREATVSEIEKLKAEIEKDSKELHKELSKLSANPMVNPKVYVLGAKIGIAYIRLGYKTFKPWAEKVLSSVGDEIRPWLRSIWNGIANMPKDAPFDAKKYTGAVLYCGNRIEKGMLSYDMIADDFKERYGEQAYNNTKGYLQAAYVAADTRLHPEKYKDAQKGENNHADDSTSGLAERAGRGSDSDAVGPDDASGESGRRSGRGVQEAEGAVRPEGGVRVRDRSTAAGGETGDRGVQVEESGDRAGSAGSAHVSRSVSDSYEGSVGHDADRTAASIRLTENRRDNASPAGARARAVKPNKSGKRGDLGSIKNDLPMLQPEQQEDVEFIETRVNVNNKPGTMLTNGTGTGKTYSGLGFIKRMYDAGKKNILIVSPSESINDQWIEAANKHFDLSIEKLSSTKDSGKDGGICITTYANLQANRELVNRNWDAVVSDESHTLMQNEKGEETGYLSMLRALTMNPRGAYKRFKLQHRTKEIRSLENQIEEREKKVKAILRPYGNKKKISSADKAKVDALQKEIESLDKEMEGIYLKMSPGTDKLMQDLKAAYPEEKRPKVLFLSATPFSHDKDVDYAEGYLFHYDEDTGRYGGYNVGTPSDQFMVKHFGYRMRTGKLTRPDAEVDSRAMEVQFHDDLVNSGAMHGRQIAVDKDYDRGFILVDGGIGHKIDEGFKFLSDNHAAYGELYRVLAKQFNKSQQKYLIESIKAREVIPLIQEYVKKGKKVVLFHQSMVEHKNIHPFQLKPSADLAENSEVWAQWKAFKSARPDLVDLSLGNIPAPMETLRKELSGHAVFINGNVPKKDRAKNIERFNDDDSGVNIIVCQQDAANAGISLHDTTGKHPRVLINIAMPERPSYAMQIEGRIYRVGNASNAVFRYLSTGTDIEKNMFASTIGGRAASVENLAVGNAARGLRESFRDLYQETMDGSWKRRLPGAEGEGTGGKELDYAATSALSDYDRAKSFYFAQQKRTARTKAQEGNDYFSTPEPIGYKMVEWLGLKPGEKALEPSAGHGAISRWFPENVERTIVEPSAQLAPIAQMNTPDAKVVHTRFEDFNIVNKFDGIAMNPPFGTGGKTAVEHLQKAFHHLRDGGRVIAILPEGPAADKRLDKLLDEIVDEAVRVADIHLPAVTFTRASTKVMTHIVVLDRYTKKAERDAALANLGSYADIDLRHIDGTKELFDRLEGISLPDRTDVKKQAERAKDAESQFTTDTYEHTKTHEMMFKARPRMYLGDSYREVSKLAKEHGGYYSRYADNSFLFKNEEDRDAFVKQADELLGEKEERYSAEEQQEEQARALDELKQEVRDALPGARDIQDDGNRLSFTMPNGAKVEVQLSPSIEVSDTEAGRARAAHGIKPSARVKINGRERTIGATALVELSQLGRKGTAYHEAFHAVYDMCLTDKEKAALHKAYDKEAKAQGRDTYEVMADKYRDWMIAKQKGQHTLYGKLWQKVKDVAARLARVVRGADNAGDVFRKMASGEAWERPLNEGGSDNRYLVTNEEVRPDTEVPIVDVTNEKKINVNSNKAAADIAKSLQGVTFRIIASNGVGKIETLKEGKHFVHGSNNLGRFDKTRAKALSVSEKILDNCVYIEKHPDAKHGTNHRYIELFAAVKDGRNMVRFRVVAREGDAGSGEFKIGQARFYDIIKDGKLPMYDTNGRNSIMGSSPSTLTVAELLKGVKDRNGHLYVNKDGSLNYDARIFRNGEEQANIGTSIEDSETRYSAEEEKKGAQSFLNAAASKLGKRMGVKSDKIITEEAKAKEGIGILDYLIASPSRVATRVKSFRQFYRMGVRAMDVLTERRSYYQRKLGKAMQLVKSKNDYEELTDILLSGDAEGKEWTKEELIQSGTKENVAEAYTRIRRLMRQAYKMVNEAHKHPKTYSKRLSDSKIEELRQNPFVKIMKIHDEEDDGRRLVTYREFANYEHTLEGVTKQALDEMRVDEDMQVIEATKQADGTYKVRVREGRGDVTNRKGYIPHFFHNYMVEVRDEDGNYVTTITSGRTQREAVKKAEEWMKDNKLEDGQKIYIHPKIFDFTRYGMSEKGIVQLGDKDFYALMNRVAKDNDMSLEEAKDLLQNVHQKNRHRFFGNVLHRKGVSGFETDMNYVLNHYFNSASRYYAMETEFKPQAISLYERLFGDFAKDSKNSLAQYVKDYINDVNGTPSALERGVNDALMRSKVYRDFVVSHYGERAVLQLSSNIAGATTYMCLGYFNVSSALLNLTQVMNSAAYIGDVSALGKCLSKGMHRKYSLHDLKVLKETNVLNDIGLDSGSGYDVNRMSAKSLLGKINKAGMSFFKVSEQTVRIGTVLAAYESGIKRGMSHEEAIDFAKEVNQKSNFDYSVADAPNIFRRGSFLSQLALQFKKYGIKELEVMADMCSPRTSRKQKLIFWGTYLLAAGLCGLPALDWLDEVLGWVFGKSPKLAAQEAIMEATGGTPVGKFIGRMAMYGLPSSLVGVDLSNRVGLSDVVPTELKGFLPPLATKIPQFMQDIFSEAKINAVRDFSPAIYNQIAAWGTGKSYDKRGRINAEYNTFYDKLLRSIGFKSTDERVDSDIRRITSERRSELTKKKQKAVDAYIAHPTPQNMQKLKDLGIKDSTVEKERERKKEDSYNRTKGGMTKKEAQENQQLLNFK